MNVFLLSFYYSCLYNVLCCKKKCGNPEVLKTCLRKLKKTISEAATRFSGYHQHVRDISLQVLLITVGPHLFELDYFELPGISNSKPFSLDMPLNHLLSAISNSCHFELYFISLKISKQWDSTVPHCKLHA